LPGDWLARYSSFDLEHSTGLLRISVRLMWLCAIKIVSFVVAIPIEPQRRSVEPSKPAAVSQQERRNQISQ
jgi:hypothetical protein